MSPAEDLSDVEAVLRGEIDRFEGIVSRWERPLVNLAWRYVHDEAIAEEMAQEAFLKCFRKLKQWRRDAEFSTWLFALAINVYRSSLRRRKLVIESGLPDDMPDDTSLESDLVTRQQDELIHRAVRHLPEIYRDAIVLYYFQEKDLATTARLLGQPEGTIKARLHRARKMLEERLGEVLE